MLLKCSACERLVNPGRDQPKALLNRHPRQVERAPVPPQASPMQPQVGSGQLVGVWVSGLRASSQLIMVNRTSFASSGGDVDRSIRLCSSPPCRRGDPGSPPIEETAVSAEGTFEIGRGFAAQKSICRHSGYRRRSRRQQGQACYEIPKLAAAQHGNMWCASQVATIEAVRAVHGMQNRCGPMFSEATIRVRRQGWQS